MKKKSIIITSIIILAIICIAIVVLNNSNKREEKEKITNNSSNGFADEVIDEKTQNDGEEIKCETIKFNIKGSNGYEEIQKDFFAIYAQNDGLMRIETYNKNQDLEDFYNDDIILEEANSININVNHEYLVDVDENGKDNTITPKELKDRINSNQISDIREKFKIESKENIDINGIKGIKYSYSFAENETKMNKEIYILKVNDKIYKFNIISENNVFKDIINSVKKI